MLSIEEARSLVRAAVDLRLRERDPGLLVLRGTPGVGKTTIALHALQDAVVRGGVIDWRAFVGMERLDLIEEVLARAEFAELRKVSAVRYGRTDDADSPGHCADIETANAFARRRQGVMRSYCAAKGEGRCPFAAKCSYLAHVREAKEARVVFGATALLRTEASELGDFDVILVDEALDTALVETLRVAREDVDVWRAGQGRGEAAAPPPVKGAAPPPAEAATPLLEVLAHALAATPPTVEGRRTPLRPVIEHAAGLLGVDARAAVQATLSARTDREGRLPCEVPRQDGEGTRVPLRALRQVAEVLDEELSRPVGADTRAWLVGGNGAAPAIEFRVPRRRLVEVLSRATTINLDATPNLPLLQLAFPDVEVLSVSVPERVEVVQLVDALYVSATVEKHAAELGEVLARHFEGAERPAVFCEKRFRPDLARKDGERPTLQVPGVAPAWGHFGGNSRGTNAFSDVDALAIVGHFLPPIDEAEADVRALRFAAVPPPAGLEEVLVPYAGTRQGQLVGAADDVSRARWVRRHPDPDVAEVLDARRAAMVRQVIGRARPSLRPGEAPPLRVLLAAGWPLPDLPVARLTTRAELLRSSVEAPDANEGRPNPLTRENARRHEAFACRVEQAIGDVEGRGDQASARQVARELDLTSGRSVTRIAQLLGGARQFNQPPRTPRALKGSSLAVRGVHPLDGRGLLPLWIAAVRGRSACPTQVGLTDRPFAVPTNQKTRGPPATKPTHLQEVRRGSSRNASQREGRGVGVEALGSVCCRGKEERCPWSSLALR